MQTYLNYGKVNSFTTSGATCITSANAAIIGILFAGTATSNAQLWCGTTATGAGQLTPIIRGVSTIGAGTTPFPAVWFPIPCYASGGITINIGAANDVNTMLFWSPT